MIGLRDLLLINIKYLLQSANSFENRYKKKGISFMPNIDQLSEILKKLQNGDSIDETVFNGINAFAETLFDKSFQSLHFKDRDYADNLKKLYGIIQEVARIDPGKFADSISLKSLEKLDVPRDLIAKYRNKIPLTSTEKQILQEKIDLHKSRFDRFNGTIETIRNAVLQCETTTLLCSNNTTNVLEIASLLLLLIINAHSHQYFVENLFIEANSRVLKPYAEDQIQEFLSVERTFDQNGKIVNDIRAIRNVVSKGNFSISNENASLEIDIRSDIASYNVVLKGSKLKLLGYVHNYIHLIDMQELIIRMALSQALLQQMINIQLKD